MGYGYGPGWNMMGWGGGYGFGYGLIHMVISIVVIIAIVFFVMWLVRTMSPAHHPGMRRSSGLDVLEERYARGEINRDEYLQKKKDIGG